MTTPVDLFRIVMTPQVWTFTSSTVEEVHNSERYRPLAIGRGAIEQKNELSRNSLEVAIPLDHELAVSLLSSFSEQVVTMTVWTRKDAATNVIWKGRLASVKPGDAALTLVFESIFTSLRRPGLRARFQKSCRHALYGRGCLLDPADFATAGTLNAVNGAVLTIPEADTPADGYFTGGMLGSPDGTLSFIIKHAGSSITLQRVPYTLSQAFAESGPGLGITLYPGCDHTRATCLAKFNNLNRYGGFDWIPNKNPVGGTSIV
jgi:uncharacterized phage protein (TIGR02218 family)